MLFLLAPLQLKCEEVGYIYIYFFFFSFQLLLDALSLGLENLGSQREVAGLRVILQQVSAAASSRR